MKNTVFILFLTALLVSVSCVRQSTHKAVIDQRDSLMAQNEQNEQMMAELQTYIDEIAMSLDSIAYHESLLFLAMF